MLAMHSSYEVIGLEDIKRLSKSLKYFYETSYKIENNTIKFL